MEFRSGPPNPPNPGPPVVPSDSATSEVGDKLAALREDVANLAESIRRVAAEQIGSSVEDVHQSLETRIRRNPTQAMLIAAGIGLVVGLILAR
jgi:ElaB/YqjD/DUF883 family membrane-anchored ribosome-binding protein